MEKLWTKKKEELFALLESGGQGPKELKGSATL